MIKNKKIIEPIHLGQPQGNKALLLFHGFSSTPAVFRHIIPSIKGYDAIVCPLLPGHGKNDAVFSKTTAKDWLLFAESNYNQLKEKFDQISVLGLSLGGLLASHLASRYTISYLYLLAPAFDLSMSLTANLLLTSILKRLGFKAIRSAAGNLSSNTACEIAYRILPLSTLIEVLTFIKNFPFSLPQCPTSLFLGRHDRIVDSNRLMQRFAHQSHIKIYWLEHSAHVLPLDNDIDLLTQQISI